MILRPPSGQWLRITNDAQLAPPPEEQAAVELQVSISLDISASMRTRAGSSGFRRPSRRGGGFNDRANFFETFDIADAGAEDMADDMPKWDHIGSTVYCSPHLPTDEAYVVYAKALCDAGGILLSDAGHMGLAMQEVEDMTGPQQYVTRIRFVG